jgi:hypothetical protein
MRKRKQLKSIREGNYLAEVSVELIETNEGWTPYLSLDDAYKLDDIRAALRNKDLDKAKQLAKIYTLQPVAV